MSFKGRIKRLSGILCLLSIGFRGRKSCLAASLQYCDCDCSTVTVTAVLWLSHRHNKWGWEIACTILNRWQLGNSSLCLTVVIQTEYRCQKRKYPETFSHLVIRLVSAVAIVRLISWQFDYMHSTLHVRSARACGCFEVTGRYCPINWYEHVTSVAIQSVFIYLRVG